MTLLNINENKRFKAGAVRFLGCLPIYDYDASRLGSDGKKRNRAMEMFHDCMSIISADIAEFCNDQHTMVCGDGRSYVVQPRIAFVAADFQQIYQNLALAGSGCHVCQCPKDSLDCTGTWWPLRDAAKTKESMYLLADKILNPDGTVKYGKNKIIKEWEQKWGVKFMENGFADLHRHGLDPHLCNPRDLLHQIPLGLYGEYIVNSTVYKLIFADSGLGNPQFWQGDRATVTDVRVKAIWTSLASRLANIREEDAGFTISAKMSKHFLKVPTWNPNFQLQLFESDIEFSGLQQKVFNLHRPSHAPCYAGSSLCTSWVDFVCNCRHILHD